MGCYKTKNCFFDNIRSECLLYLNLSKIVHLKLKCYEELPAGSVYSFFFTHIGPKNCYMQSLSISAVAIKAGS